MAMKKIHIILLLALGLGVSSCFTSYISNKQVMGVQPVSYTHLDVYKRQTEYISCPGCGRTLYDLEKTIARIKACLLYTSRCV